MTKLYRNKYRVESFRHQYWDYSNSGFYFITACTKDRTSFFGNINNDTMCLNEIGSIVYKEWQKTPDIRLDMNLSLGEFVVMPNHSHGILIIGKNEYNADGCGRDAMHCASTTTPLNKFGPQRKNVASIMRGIKSSVTIQAREINSDFGWQSRFHDHIIRDQKSHIRISNYIISNPKNWGKDNFH